MPDPKYFFWIDASVPYTATVNPNGTKTRLTNSVSTFFINGKPTDINGLRKLRNPPFWWLFFLVVFFNKIPLFCKDLAAFKISFISLFLRNVSESVRPF